MAYRRLTGISSKTSGEDPVYTYASSLVHDGFIYPYVLRVLKAHVTHLLEKNLIPEEAGQETLKALERLEQEKPPARGYEDVYEWVEERLEQLTGGLSKYVWIGRSRNDHVAAALRLYAIDRLARARDLVGRAVEILEIKEEEYKNTPVPFHTHRQPSQIGTGACLFGAWRLSLERSLRILEHAASLLMEGPLASSAGAGTIAPLDPERLNQLAGFQDALENPLYATGSRLDLAYAVEAMALLLSEVSRIAGDVILYSSPYLQVFRLPRGHVATSSIMPHKRNPATMEVLLGKTRVVLACSQAYKGIYTGLPSGYSLDLQEGNPCLYMVMEIVLDSLGVLVDFLDGLEIDEERALDIISRYPVWSAELAEKIALEEGVPLRDAYARVAELVGKGYGGLSPGEVLRLRRSGCRME